MNRETIVLFLRCLSAQNVQPHGAWVGCSCPLAPWTHDSGSDGNPSFGIKVEPTRESPYHCYSCGHGSDLMTLVHRLYELGAQAPKYDLPAAAKLAADELSGEISLHISDYGDVRAGPEPITPWPESFLDKFTPAMKVPMARRYLESRGVTEFVAGALDIRFDLSREAVAFPIRDFTHTLVGLRGRYINPKPNQPRYHAYKRGPESENTMVWYGESDVDVSAQVLFVESVFDYARAVQHHPNVLAPLSVSISRAKAERLSMIWDITTLFDVGKGGDGARETVNRYWPDACVRHLIPPASEPGLDGTPASDPGNMTDEQFDKLFRDRP